MLAIGRTKDEEDGLWRPKELVESSWRVCGEFWRVRGEFLIRGSDSE